MSRNGPGSSGHPHRHHFLPLDRGQKAWPGLHGKVPDLVQKERASVRVSQLPIAAGRAGEGAAGVPNSSLSISPGLRAATFALTNGRPESPVSACTAKASASFPAPFRPAGGSAHSRNGLVKSDQRPR